MEFDPSMFNKSEEQVDDKITKGEYHKAVELFNKTPSKKPTDGQVWRDGKPFRK